MRASVRVRRGGAVEPGVVEVLAGQAAHGRRRLAATSCAAGITTTSRLAPARARRVRDAARPGRAPARMPSRIDTLRVARAAVAAEPRLGRRRRRSRRSTAASSTAAARARSFLSSTIDARAASRASARCSAMPFDRRGRVGIDVRMLEQPELELGAQHARDRRVDHRRRDQPALKRVEIRPLLSVRRLKDDVEPGVERVAAPPSPCSASVMCSTVAPPVADASEMTKPVNPQSRLEHVGEQTPVLRRRRCRRPSCRRSSPIARRASSAAWNGGKYRSIEQALARVDRDSCRVRPRRRWRRSASASRRCRPARTPRRTRAPSPTTGYGSSPYVSSTRPQRTSSAMLMTGDSTCRMPRLPRFRGDRAGDARRRARVSHVAASAIAGGNIVAPSRVEPVHRLLERDDRNAEPRLLDEVALDGVDALGVRARASPDPRRRVATPLAAGEICRPKMPCE